MRAAAAVVVAVATSACSLVGMHAHDPAPWNPTVEVMPTCTDSLLPPIADGVMALTSSALVAADIYARRNDRTGYCGPFPDGTVPVDGCGGYEGEGMIGYPVALFALASAVVGANRYVECRAAYERAEQRQGAPLARQGVGAGTVIAASASFVVDAIFVLMAATLFTR
jgi:hypothetical protein